MISSLLLTLALGMKSCAGRGTEPQERRNGSVRGGGRLVGCALRVGETVLVAEGRDDGRTADGVVLHAPAVSMWLFGSAGVICLAANAQGYEFLFWAVASFVFAAMSWRGAKEKAADDSARGDVAPDDEAQRALDRHAARRGRAGRRRRPRVLAD